MPPKTGALLDPAAAAAFIEGYRRFLLTVPTGDRADERSVLETLVDARDRITKDQDLLRDTLAEAGKAMPDLGVPVLQAIDRDPAGHKLGLPQGDEELRSLPGSIWRVRARRPRPHATDSRRRRNIRRISRDGGGSLLRPLRLRRSGERRCPPWPQLFTKLCHGICKAQGARPLRS